MGQLSAILRSVQGGRVAFWCPGCDSPHVLPVGQGDKPRWTWNGNTEKPTFEPSILVQAHRKQELLDCCHSFVRDGKIQFLNDCTHALAGLTVDIPEWPKPDWGGVTPMERCP